MDDVEKLFKESLVEIERLLSSKSTVGEPIKFGDTTVIPLLAMGFGYGAGGGSGTDAKNNSGSGAGTGAGGGIKPIALLISDRNGVRIERVGGPSGFEVLGNTVVKVMEQQAKAKAAPATKAA